jgi:hypothetical protein
MKQTTTRKPFVAPQLKEEASLASVTLISGGGHIRGGCKKGQSNRNYGYQNKGRSNRRGH